MDHKIEDIKRVIEANYQNPQLNTEFISQASGLNAAILEQDFRKAYGMTYLQFAHSLRLPKALELLKDLRLLAKEVSEKSGFARLSQLEETLYKATGKKVREYRAELLEKHLEQAVSRLEHGETIEKVVSDKKASSGTVLKAFFKKHGKTVSQFRIDAVPA